MTYVISDLHGRYDLYRAMLEKIKLSDKDTLYILGDIVDRGDEGLKIVLDVGNRDNVTVIMGNHDYLALTILLSINRGFRPGELADMRHIIDSWNFDGGAATYNEYRNLSQADQRLALMIMDSFRNFAEIKIGGNEFVLCHGGIGNFSPERELSDYSIEDLAFYREDYSKAKFATPGKYLITGHTPTAAIEGAEEGRIYKNKDHIAIDCGAVFGYGLGCICLDTMEEFYVNE
jgi:serine/threonine protein phosphatase 1